MNDLLHNAILLAQRSRLEGLERGFKGRRIGWDDIVTGLLVVAVIALLIWVLSYFLNSQERRRAHASPIGLFLSLCSAHRLRWSERWLLWRVARRQRLRDPARLFLEPERLDRANLAPSLRLRAAEIEALRDRLFAEPEEEKNAPDPPAEEPAAEEPADDRSGTPLAPLADRPTLDIPPWPPVFGPNDDAPVADQ